MSQAKQIWSVGWRMSATTFAIFLTGLVFVFVVPTMYHLAYELETIDKIWYKLTLYSIFPTLAVILYWCYHSVSKLQKNKEKESKFSFK